jgi:tetratricopeptide (TPR) repeat protein
LMMRDLEDRIGDPLAGCRKEELRSLHPDDAVVFMRAQGVTRGTRAEIISACEAYGYHPLSLRLLSGLIARDKRNPGDIATAPRHDVHDDLVARQRHILEVAYDALSDELRLLLSQTAAFRSLVDYDAVAILNEFGNEAEFDEALDELIERGLLFFDAERRRYDLHPIVRAYAYDRLTDKKGVHSRLRNYFLPRSGKGPIQTLDNLMPVIELYHHTLKSGLSDQAWRIHSQRLMHLLHYDFGEYNLNIQLLMAIPGLSDGRPDLSGPRARIIALQNTGLSCEAAGQTKLGLSLLEQAAALSRETRNERLLGSVLVPYSMLCCAVGRLQQASTSIEECVSIFDRMTDPNWQGISHRCYGWILMVRGNSKSAVDEFAATERVHSPASSWIHSRSVLSNHRVCMHLQLGNPTKALKLAIATTKTAGIERFKWAETDAIYLVGAAQCALGELDGAEVHLHDALQRCRRINLAVLEPDVLLSLARLHYAQARALQALSSKQSLLQEARNCAEQALSIADRCEYRLKQADICNFLAQWELDAGSVADARKYAETAKDRAWCDGPPYSYQAALDKAQRLLEEIARR